MGSESLTIKVTLNAGHSMNYHSHKNRDEVWVVISGSGKTIVDGFEQAVKAGLTAMCLALRRAMDAWTAVFLHFRLFFFSFRRALPAALPCFVYLVSRYFWRRLPCYAFMFPVFSNYSFYFNNPLNSFQYYILQSYILHHYHAFTLYIPTIHNFSLYHTLSLLSPPFILSSSLLSFLYTSTTFHAFLYVLLVQSCKDIIIYLVQ